MDLKDSKSLKKLADACRKAGILEFKGFGVEFKLGALPHKPLKVTAAPKAKSPFEEAVKAAQAEAKDEVEAETPTEEELMFWSVNAEVNEQ